MDSMYLGHPDAYGASPLSFTNVPDLVTCAYDEDTDPCPTPPMPYQVVGGYQYPTYAINSSTPCTDYVQAQPAIVNSIEFTDLTHIQHEERLRGQRRSNALQDKEAASNMRIRRRAQNRASQRAFRERKEKHVQHLERQLEDLDTKHRELSKSYTHLDTNHRELQREADTLRRELDVLRENNSTPVSRSNSVGTSQSADEWSADRTARGSVKGDHDQEQEQDALYDTFCSPDGHVIGNGQGGSSDDLFQHNYPHTGVQAAWTF